MTRICSTMRGAIFSIRLSIVAARLHHMRLGPYIIDGHPDGKRWMVYRNGRGRWPWDICTFDRLIDAVEHAQRQLMGEAGEQKR
jgi:hypothetical protein